MRVPTSCCSDAFLDPEPVPMLWRHRWLLNRICPQAHLGLAGHALAEDLRLGRAYSAFPNPSDRLARRRDRAVSGRGGSDPGLPDRSGDVLLGLALASCGFSNQKLGGLEGSAEQIGGGFDVASMQARLPQLGGLVDDYDNRGSCYHPSRQDAVGAPLHRLESVYTG